ncbi:MAG: AI-2E family transporter [bacterium]
MTPKRAYFKVKDRRTARKSNSPPSPASRSTPPPATRLRRSFAFLLLGLSALAAVLWISAQSTFVAGLMVIAVALASLLEPVVCSFEKQGWSRVTGVIAAFLPATLVFFFFFQFCTPRLSQEAETLSTFFASPRAERFSERALDWLIGIFPWLQNLTVKQRLLQDYYGLQRALEQGALHLTSTLLTSWPVLIVLAILVFILLAESRALRRAIIDAVPNHYWEESVLLLHETPKRVNRFLRVQVLIAFFVALAMVLAYYLMRLPCFLTFGVIAGLSSFLPYFGSLVGATITVLLGVIQTGAYHLTLPVLLAFATIDLIKNAALSLRAFKAGLVLGPLETILGMLLGGSLAGVWGVFFAAPALALIKIVLQEGAKIMRDFRGR